MMVGYTFHSRNFDEVRGLARCPLFTQKGKPKYPALAEKKHSN
jgi:hypothetical protein